MYIIVVVQFLFVGAFNDVHIEKHPIMDRSWGSEEACEEVADSYKEILLPKGYTAICEPIFWYKG